MSIREDKKTENLKTTKVLLVDGDDQIRRLFALALRRSGNDVEELKDTGSLKHRLVSSPPINVLVSDAHMPGEPVLDILEHMDEQMGHMSVVLITSYPDDDVFARASRFNVAQILEKPFDLNYLCNVVDECASNKSVSK